MSRVGGFFGPYEDEEALIEISLSATNFCVMVKNMTCLKIGSNAREKVLGSDMAFGTPFGFVFDGESLEKLGKELVACLVGRVFFEVGFP